MQPAADPTAKGRQPREDSLLSRIELKFSAVLYPLGFALEIRTNNQAVLDAAEESWGGRRPLYDTAPLLLKIVVTESATFECPPAPLARVQGHLISMAADAQNQFVGDVREGFAFGYLSEAALRHRSYARYYFIEPTVYVMMTGLFVTPIHAACISRRGHGMLLCGPSGAGKSTLAYACARAGWTYTTDDASYLVRAGHGPRVVGNSHQLRFRPTARQLFPELSGRSITPRAEGKPSIEVPTAELPGLIASDEASIRSILFLNRQPSAAAELIPLPREAAFDHFSTTLYAVKEIRDMQIAALESLAGADVFELRYSDVSDAIHCLEGLVELADMLEPPGPDEDALV